MTDVTELTEQFWAQPEPGRPESESLERARTPYQRKQPYGSVPDLVHGELFPADERMWVPQSDDVSFRPLLFGVSQGYYVNLLRVRRAAVLSRHRHAGPVHATILRGRWHYLEHDWTAVEGGYASNRRARSTPWSCRKAFRRWSPCSVSPGR